jgi:hypothetical protein
MSNFSVFYRLTPSLKQKVTWFVLFALLFIQARMAVGGCLISGCLPPPQQAEQVMQMKSAGDPCTEHSSPGKPSKQLCRMHCEQSSNTPKFTFDLPLFASVVFLTSVPLFTVADAASFETPTQSPATTGPPRYLRFLRLLN